MHLTFEVTLDCTLKMFEFNRRDSTLFFFRNEVLKALQRSTSEVGKWKQAEMT